jgi:hypothetical protein
LQAFSGRAFARPGVEGCHNGGDSLGLWALRPVPLGEYWAGIAEGGAYRDFEPRAPVLIQSKPAL